jgi:hypothetical protein
MSISGAKYPFLGAQNYFYKFGIKLDIFMPISMTISFIFIPLLSISLHIHTAYIPLKELTVAKLFTQSLKCP